MATVLLLIHLILAVAMICVVLLQKSEGGALGIGGGSGGAGGFLTGRGTANLLTRTTAMLAAGFFITSLALTLLAQRSAGPSSVFDNVAPSSTPAANGTAPAAPEQGRGGILDKLQQRGGPAVPQGR
jgi:preprotein translocase subunit SecG